MRENLAKRMEIKKVRKYKTILGLAYIALGIKVTIYGMSYSAAAFIGAWFMLVGLLGLIVWNNKKIHTLYLEEKIEQLNDKLKQLKDEQ
jgi:hypothetical protein